MMLSQGRKARKGLLGLSIQNNLCLSFACFAPLRESAFSTTTSKISEEPGL